MCGIIGLCFSEFKDKLGYMLFKGLERLEYRGYDSAGIAVVSKEGITVLKGKGKLRELEQKYKFTSIGGVVGVGHTRWATHGAPSDENAHPHTDCTSTFAVVHNGIIENYYELKRELLEKGHVFKSETDTEVVPHLVEELYEAYGDVYKAFKEAVKKLRGAYALLLITPLEPNKIFFAKKDSPLVIGLADGYTCLASDIPALLDHTRSIIVLRDGWVGYVTPREILIEDLGSNTVVQHERYTRFVEWSLEEVSKGGYPHFMLKEIHEQPQALLQTLAGLKSDSVLDKVAMLVANAERVFVTGAGTSYHASEFYALASYMLVGKPVVPFIASEYEVYASSIREGDVLIVVSQSGETMDALKATRAFKKKGARVVAVSNVVESAIPRESDYAVYMRAGPEIGVAATKTFTTQTLALSWLLIKVGEINGSLSEKEARELFSILEKAPKLAREVIEHTEKSTAKLAETLASAKSMYYLSRSIGVPIAREGALKIKEVSYIHAEAYPAGESKHGPIALVEPGFPVVFVVPPLEHVENLLAGNVEEMKARGAFTIGIARNGSSIKSLFDVVFEVPGEHWLLTPITYTPPLQLLAYYAAVRRGFDPDKPRNLAKTVTVE